MAKQKIPIVSVNHGIANRFADCIEVNKHLHNYPKLYYPIIRHELKHTNKPGFSIQDFKHDINAEDSVNRLQLLKFMFKHPRSFTQILPIYYTRKRRFVVDINLGIMYGIMFLIGFLIYLLLY